MVFLEMCGAGRQRSRIALLTGRSVLHRPQRRVQLAIFRVSPVHERPIFLHGRYGGGYAYCCIASRLDTFPDARSDTGEQGRAVGSAFLGFDNFHRVTINVRLNLAPQLRARSATTEPDGRDGAN